MQLGKAKPGTTACSIRHSLPVRIMLRFGPTNKRSAETAARCLHSLHSTTSSLSLGKANSPTSAFSTCALAVADGPSRLKFPTLPAAWGRRWPNSAAFSMRHGKVWEPTRESTMPALTEMAGRLSHSSLALPRVLDLPYAPTTGIVDSLV